jgi:uncharacterized repeat protein (TIGR03847 family)
MADLTYEFKPATRLTIDAVGQPGERVFYFQASQGTKALTLKMEKEQARALALSIDELLQDIGERFPQKSETQEIIPPADFALQPPLESDFVVGQIGLGYDDTEDLVIMIMQEVVLEGGQTPAVARIWASRNQMRALSEYALTVVEKGRPKCPLCGRPIDPQGHFCPRSNGHGKANNVF